jgi:hypothetical protein
VLSSWSASTFQRFVLPPPSSPWWRRHYAPMKYWSSSKRLLGPIILCQKAVIFGGLTTVHVKERYHIQLFHIKHNITHCDKTHWKSPLYSILMSTACKKITCKYEKIFFKATFSFLSPIPPARYQMTLRLGLPESSVGRIRSFPDRYHSTMIINDHVSPEGWTIGQLVAAVQRRVLTTSTWPSLSTVIKNHNI